MLETIKQLIIGAVSAKFNKEVEPQVSIPDEKFGDFATNVAMKLTVALSKNPREIAEQIVQELVELPEIVEATVAGPGFINVKMSDEFLLSQLSNTPTQNWAGKVVVCEYSDPNPFKVLHAGHLYTGVVGDCISNLYEVAGAEVHRVNFGGDVGRHVAQTMWAILYTNTENPGDEARAHERVKSLETKSLQEKANWLAEHYILGTKAYEDDEAAKTQIIALNKKVYQIHTSNDRTSVFAQIYWTTRGWSYDYFDEFYASIGTKFEKYYPESQTAQIGLQTVQEQLTKGVFKESNGAVVFDGEQYGLHTRVFINSEGLPTYETKDIGLSLSKWNDYKFDLNVMITGNDITEYMKVVLKALEQFEPEIANRSRHITHGIVKLVGGEKMSSRKGNILRAADVLEAAKIAATQAGNPKEEIVLGAVKYAFLKHGIGADIHYDPGVSVATVGNSGPYLQYAHARACSVLSKAEGQKRGVTASANLEAGERLLVKKLSQYSEVVDRSVLELIPHHICTYLYELAQEFNRFYEQNRVIDDSRQDLRLALVGHYADTLKKGLNLLGIQAPEQM